jgi:hypothetical protein
MLTNRLSCIFTFYFFTLSNTIMMALWDSGFAVTLANVDSFHQFDKMYIYFWFDVDNDQTVVTTYVRFCGR